MSAIYDNTARQIRHLQNARKPSEDGGAEILTVMNGGNHKILAEWGLSQIEIPAGTDMLDIGCGGGANLARLMKKNPEGYAYGVDYSEVSVRMSRETNEDAIAAGRCAVMEGDVNDLPFRDDMFGFVSAFETIYFWPYIEHAFREVRRVMKEGGMFFICNESDGQDEGSVKNAEIFGQLSLYTPELIRELLKSAGFRDIQIYRNSERPHIVVTGIK